jgi:restriction endonuclease S subunit
MSIVDQKDLGSFPIPVPPLAEQRQIVAILTRCDETITAARANVGAAKTLKMKMINEMLSPENH